MKYLIDLRYLMVLLVVILLVGCQSSVPETEPAAAKAVKEAKEAAGSPTAAVVSEKEPALAQEEVAILGREGFDPEELTITEGKPVVFVNQDSRAVVITFQHNTSRKVANSVVIPPGESYIHSFTEAGTYDYWTIGYGIKGKITVE